MSVLAPTIPEPILDSVRGWLLFGNGPRTLENLRYYVRRHAECHADDVPSGWASLPDSTHVTESMYAEVLYRAFKRAEAE